MSLHVFDRRCPLVFRSFGFLALAAAFSVAGLLAGCERSADPGSPESPGEAGWLLVHSDAGLDYWISPPRVGEAEVRFDVRFTGGVPRSIVLRPHPEQDGAAKGFTASIRAEGRSLFEFGYLAETGEAPRLRIDEVSGRDHLRIVQESLLGGILVRETYSSPGGCVAPLRFVAPVSEGIAELPSSMDSPDAGRVLVDLAPACGTIPKRIGSRPSSSIRPCETCSPTGEGDRSGRGPTKVGEGAALGGFPGEAPDAGCSSARSVASS